MSANHVVVLPWETRDKEDQAKAAYHHPLRKSNQTLKDENMRLKRLLRENGISWSPIAQAHINKQAPDSRRRTRLSLTSQVLGCPTLPTEVVLRIMKYALQSPAPIIDPLSRLIPENLSDEEKTRGNQIAIHLLATCKALNVEGTKFLWESNNFLFTNPEALSHFAELQATYRQKIPHITLRVIARYYDDQKRKHRIQRDYHPDLKKDMPLSVRMRPKEQPLVRGGFRCYSWSQIVDFLSALRAPYDPSHKNHRKNPRPRLLPSLSSMRIDLVNFSESLLPFSGPDMHEIASHELGCTLNELQITGIPYDEAGLKASYELTGMLKDEGLYLEANACYIAQQKTLQPLKGMPWNARVPRAYSKEDKEADEESSWHEDHDMGSHHHRPKLGAMPPAPAEEGHPETHREHNRVIWKRVPLSRDNEKRSWVLFSRFTGNEVPNDSWGGDEEVCPCCGETHSEVDFGPDLEDLSNSDWSDDEYDAYGFLDAVDAYAAAYF